LKQNTGGLVDIKLENQEWKTFLDTRRAGNYDVARAGWAADYNQASTFGKYFLSNSSNNTARYKSAAYDAEINAAYQAGNAEERAAAYAKAEAQLA
ncbi:oligopeptide ABC transporter substrate-binding protein OppA, partial [Glaesserella parasuis]|nr:oligopeptide ABC transporter substrate-binding protein OppA [Glaesserella parasuis]